MGCRLRYSVVGFVVTSCVVIALVGLVGPVSQLVAVEQSEAEQRNRLIVNALTQSVNAFFLFSQGMPQHAGELLASGVVNLYSRDAVLPVFTTLLRGCAPSCQSIYFGLPNDFYLTRGQDQFCQPIVNGGGFRECCSSNVVNATTCTATFANTSKLYYPTQRPWYAALGAGPAWASLYVDFNSGGFASTVGGPIVAPNGTKLGVFAVDISLVPLEDQLQRLSLVDRPSAWVLYEAGTLNLLDTSFGVRSASRTYTIDDVRRSDVLGGALDHMTVNELNVDGTATKIVGSFIGRQFITVSRVANLTGVNLRLLVLYQEDPSGQTRQSLIITISLSIALVTLVSAAVLVGAILAFERPLREISVNLQEVVAKSLTAPTPDPAASVEEDKPKLHTSWMQEVQDIAASFDDLYDELLHLRAFVPASCTLGVSFDDRSSVDARTQCDDEKDAVDAAEVLSSISSGAHSDAAKLSAPATPRRPSLTAVAPGTPKERSHHIMKVRSATLFVSKGLAHAHVTYLTVSLRCATEIIAHMHDIAAAGELFSNFAETCELAASRCGGVVDQYTGDHCTIAFNAVRPAHDHVRAAVECAIGISKLVRSHAINESRHRVAAALHPERWEWLPPAKVTSGAVTKPFEKSGIASGVATSDAWVGNVGSSRLTRFAVIGTCVNRSAELERRCSKHRENETLPTHRPLQCLCDGALKKAIDFWMVYQCVDVSRAVDPPTMVIAPMRMIADIAETAAASASIAPISVQDDGNDREWMYELARAHGSNEFVQLNEAYSLFARRLFDQSRAKLLQATAVLGDHVPGVERLTELLNEVAS